MDKSLESLFEHIDSEILTEDLKLELSAIFEQKLHEELELKEKELEKKYADEFNSIKQNLIETIDNYLNYVAEELLSENFDSIIDIAEVQRAKKINRVFNEMVNSFNVELTESNLDLASEIEDLKKALNMAISHNQKLKENLNMYKMNELIEKFADEIPVMSIKESFLDIAKSLPKFSNEKELQEKLVMLKDMLMENANNNSVNSSKELKNDILSENINVEKVNKYLKFL